MGGLAAAKNDFSRLFSERFTSCFSPDQLPENAGRKGKIQAMRAFVSPKDKERIESRTKTNKPIISVCAG